MWRIDIDGEAVYSPDVGIAAGNPVLTQGLNAADQLTFDITPDQRLYDAIRAGVLTSRYIVYRDGSPVSYGRILAVETQPLNAVAKVTCEGELAYLNDAVLPEYDFGGSPSDYLKMFVDEYVKQTGSDLKLGRVTIADSNDYIVRGNEMPTALLPELLDKTVNSTAGGVLRIRHEGGNRYLDWLAEPDTPGSQAIAKGSNLLNLSSVVDGASIVTAIMPIGAQGEDGTYVRIPASKDGTVSGDVKRKGAYLYTAKGVQKYGWHAQVMQWEDVTEPANLRTKAIAAVRALAPETTITASAVDLTDAGYNVDAIALGQSVPIECDDIATRLFVTGCEFHMDYPADSTYTFGKLAELTANVATPDSAGWTDPKIYAKQATIDGALTVSGSVAVSGSVTADNIHPMQILSYGHSTWADFLAAYNTNSVVYCRASSNSNPATGSQTRLAFMAYVNSDPPTSNVEFQYYRSVSSHTASQQGDQVYVYKLTNTNQWSVTVREASVKVAAGTGLTMAYSGGTATFAAKMLTGSVQVPVVANGEISEADRPQVTFPSAITGSSPAVFFTMGSSPSVWHMRDLHFGANLIGNSSDGYTGFYVRCVNTGSNTGAPWVRWMAVWN